MTQITDQMTPEGEAKLIGFEGRLNRVYDDATGKPLQKGQKAAGTLTGGIGHTGPDLAEWIGKVIPDEVIDGWFRQDVAEAADAVDRAVKVDLTPFQRDALISFVFNLGAGAFRGSTLLKRLNAGRYDDVPAQIMLWNHIGKKVDKGLTNRRAAECGLWAKGSFVASNTVVPDVPKPAAGKGGVLGGAAVVVVGTIGAAQQITEATQKLGNTIAPSFGDYAPYVTPAVLFIVLVGFGAWWLLRAHKRQQEAA
jgi:lysozyme